MATPGQVTRIVRYRGHDIKRIVHAVERGVGEKVYIRWLTEASEFAFPTLRAAKCVIDETIDSGEMEDLSEARP